MIDRYFSRPPLRRIGVLLFGPAMGVLAIGFLAVDGLIKSDSSTQQKRWQTIRTETVRGEGAPLGLRDFYVALFRAYAHFPVVCKGEAVNQLQIQQCEEYRTWRDHATLLGVMPFLGVGMLYALVLSHVRQMFRRARLRLRKGQSEGIGTVTDPAIAPSDWFCRAYALRKIAVQLPNGVQMGVYFPIDAPVPFPGEKVAVIRWVKYGADWRYIGSLYAPHLAVIRGT